MTLKLKKLEAGVYQSADGRVLIRREVSRQTGRADEVSWSLEIDGTYLFDYETKREAVAAAVRRLAQPDRLPPPA
jgi:hypothetical protein